jgi:hypothetical protein
MKGESLGQDHLARSMAGISVSIVVLSYIDDY